MASTNPPTAPAEIKALSFEEALKELETIVRKLENGTGELEHSIADYVRGTALKEHCELKLADARLKVDMLIKQQDGSLGLKPFSAES